MYCRPKPNLNVFNSSPLGPNRRNPEMLENKDKTFNCHYHLLNPHLSLIKMAPALVRSLATRHLSLCVLLPKRLLSTFSITHPPSLPIVLPWRQSLPSLSHALQSINKTTNPTRFTAIRCRVNRAGNSGYSPLNSGSNFSDRPPNEMAPLFPGCDYEHWLIVMDKPGGEGATKQQMIDCYIQTLSKVVGR